MNLLNNVIAGKILYMLIRPTTETPAYKLKLVDAKARVLKPYEKMTPKEKEAYGSLDRVIFTVKHMLSKVPGGQTQLAALALGYRLVKEAYEQDLNIHDLCEEAFPLLEENVILVEETYSFTKLLEEFGGMSTAMVTPSAQGAMGPAQIDNPLRARRKKKFSDIAKRPKNVHVSV